MNDDVIDTVEAGAGSYPEPPEDKLKCYQFEFNAENEEQAEELIRKEKYDDIIDTWGMEITDITNIELSEE